MAPIKPIQQKELTVLFQQFTKQTCLTWFRTSFKVILTNGSLITSDQAFRSVIYNLCAHYFNFINEVYYGKKSDEYLKETIDKFHQYFGGSAPGCFMNIWFLITKMFVDNLIDMFPFETLKGSKSEEIDVRINTPLNSLSDAQNSIIYQRLESQLVDLKLNCSNCSDSYLKNPFHCVIKK